MNQAVIERLRGELTGLREQGLYKSERVLAGPQGGVVRAGERDVINLCANNYLGLANHALVRAAAQRDPVFILLRRQWRPVRDAPR
jgi:glycine C-acetyltransferase